jgi:ribonucleoside-diphosphate reductase beta chain
MKPEPILDQQNFRRTIFPIHHQDIWKFYEEQEDSFWKANEVDLSQDNFKALSKDEQYFIKHILGFFASSDSIVAENLAVNFGNLVKYPEAQYYYQLQTVMENIHSVMYSLLIETYITDSTEKTRLFNAIDTMPIINKKLHWAIDWINNGTFQEKLIAFICVEGILFCSSFSAIFWLKNQGKMPGLGKANEFISRDESHHCNFAIHLYNNHCINKLDKDKVKEIILEACRLEKEFAIESLPVSLIGMNNVLMVQYIEFVTDGILDALNLDKQFNSTNPFTFMNQIAVPRKTNFFESRVSEYVRAGGEMQLDAEF